MIGVHPAGSLLWHASHRSLVTKPWLCLPLLPTAPRNVPVWHVMQLPENVAWLTLTGIQPDVV